MVSAFLSYFCKVSKWVQQPRVFYDIVLVQLKSIFTSSVGVVGWEDGSCAYGLFNNGGLADARTSA